MKTCFRFVQRNNSLTVYSPAKLNLFLEVRGKRRDGYHSLETFMQTINLYDVLTFRISTKRRPKFSSLRVHGFLVPSDERNSVYRAVQLLSQFCHRDFPVDMTLRKRIPVGSGLGGGSSNAVATLFALNRLFHLKLGEPRLRCLAEQLGSDTAFFVRGGLALCTGRGERVRSLLFTRPLHFVLVCPALEISTAKVYRELDREGMLPKVTLGERKINLSLASPRARLLVDSLRNGKYDELGYAFWNRLQMTSLSLYPSLRRIFGILHKVGFLGVSMTGSGSAFFGLCRSRKEAMQKAEKVKSYRVRRVYVVRSIAPV